MPLSPIQKRLLSASDAILEAPPDEVLFLHSVMAQTYFPTKQQPPEVRRWERHQGRAHLEVDAGRA